MIRQFPNMARFSLSDPCDATNLVPHVESGNELRNLIRLVRGLDTKIDGCTIAVYIFDEIIIRRVVIDHIRYFSISNGLIQIQCIAFIVTD